MSNWYTLNKEGEPVPYKGLNGMHNYRNLGEDIFVEAFRSAKGDSISTVFSGLDETGKGYVWETRLNGYVISRCKGSRDHAKQMHRIVCRQQFGLLARLKRIFKHTRKQATTGSR